MASRLGFACKCSFFDGQCPAMDDHAQTKATGSQGPNIAHWLAPAFRCFLQPQCSGVQASGHST
eukprot:11891947-Alexandrium_andersonii.AAC.1